MARKKQVQYFKYECTMTGKTYRTTKKAANPEELISVNAFYEMNPELDDRPEHIKISIGLDNILENSSEETTSEENSDDSPEESPEK